jgi:hypothetical protein
VSKDPSDGKVFADYTFGRMMKVGFSWPEEGNECRDEVPRLDYHAWSRVFPTYEALIRAAIKEMEK